MRIVFSVERTADVGALVALARSIANDVLAFVNAERRRQDDQRRPPRQTVRRYRCGQCGNVFELTAGCAHPKHCTKCGAANDWDKPN